MGLFEKLKSGLARTAQQLVDRFDDIVRLADAPDARQRDLDGDTAEALEEILIMADVGVAASREIVAAVGRGGRRTESLRDLVKQEIVRILESPATAKAVALQPSVEMQATAKAVALQPSVEGEGFSPRPGPTFAAQSAAATVGKPEVILVVGVNGVGKTTTIGKLANQLKREGRLPLICAADTFRAAAVDQLQVWADRAGVDIVRAREGADPAAVVFDAITAGKARRRDVVLVDTAGRLHTRTNLMNELDKIRRIAAREVPGAPHEVLLILDATVGQNGLAQAREFLAVAGVTGIVLTKLDGTAKGGIAVAIAHDLKLPIRYIGVGEGVDDLLPFTPRDYVDALFQEKW